MGWQDDLRRLGEQLVSGEIGTAEYRVRSDEILQAADRDAAADTQPTDPPETQETAKRHIPVSAAWEAPTGEMTQIVGTQDKTTLVNNSIADKLEQPDD